jgi:hydroxypyruvate isomerase
MTLFSANLGFLWKELYLPDAIRAAKSAGFDAVECHFPYETAARDVVTALRETGLEMLSLNTVRGNLTKGENGLAALPWRKPEARSAIDEALAYAGKTGTRNIHVMAGIANGEEARDVFIENLDYATNKAARIDCTILIEPLNRYDAPGYFLQTTSQARSIIDTLGKANLKLMFDCYHVQLMEGDLSHRIEKLGPVIGHVQIAGVPDRSEPDRGELWYPHIFEVLRRIGYSSPVGAEYRPRSNVESGLGWLEKFRNHA